VAQELPDQEVWLDSLADQEMWLDFASVKVLCLYFRRAKGGGKTCKDVDSVLVALRHQCPPKEAPAAEAAPAGAAQAAEGQDTADDLFGIGTSLGQHATLSTCMG
jgi:hypothetical protein